MNESRYRDKSYLVTYELTTDIFDAFGIKVDEIVPVRSVYILYTDKGVRILKKINYSIEELKFIDDVTNYIIENGYKYVVPFMKTNDGNYFIKRDDGYYVVLELVEGREADYLNILDIKEVSIALSKLHKAASGFEHVIKTRDNLCKWIPAFQGKADDMRKFKEIADIHQIKTDFDNLFLSYYDKYIQEAEKSVQLIKSSAYMELCNSDDNVKCICHHDLAYHNVLIGNDSNVYFVDFDFCLFDLRIHDIGNLIVKSIKHCCWDVEKAWLIIDNYSGISSICNKELDALYGFLYFPQDFYEVSRQYYMKTKNWDEEDFCSRLERKISYCTDREAFLYNFRERIDKRADQHI